MSRDLVRAALGEPRTITTSDWLGDRWYYSSKWRWTAYCEFDGGRLRDWVEPEGEQE